MSMVLTNLWCDLFLQVWVTFQHRDGLLDSLCDQFKVVCNRLPDPDRLLRIRVSQVLVVVHGVETILLLCPDVQFQIAKNLRRLQIHNNDDQKYHRAA